jgi:hypothetical protein
VTARPALANVLAVLTTESDAAWWRGVVGRYAPRIDGAVVLGVGRGGAAYDVGRLRHATPAEALAALVEAEALPEHWLDAARAPRWWAVGPCGTCGGCRGGATRWSDDCDGRSVIDLDAPPSHAALVAVTSLGVDTLARAEAIVAETWPGRALVWRVMTAAALQKHHADHCAGLDVTPALVFSREMTPPLTNFEWRPAWPEVCPYGGLFGTPDDDRHGVHRAWPALRALAALGLHLVALDASRVVIAVEALS